MEKLKTEPDGSFGYVFNGKDLREMIQEKYPDLIDDKHKFDSIDFGKEDIGFMIVKNCCGKKVYKDDNIKCGEWSNGDQHFCKDCFMKNEVSH